MKCNSNNAHLNLYDRNAGLKRKKEKGAGGRGSRKKYVSKKWRHSCNIRYEKLWLQATTEIHIVRCFWQLNNLQIILTVMINIDKLQAKSFKSKSRNYSDSWGYHTAFKNAKHWSFHQVINWDCYGSISIVVFVNINKNSVTKQDFLGPKASEVIRDESTTNRQVTN